MATRFQGHETMKALPHSWAFIQIQKKKKLWMHRGLSMLGVLYEGKTAQAMLTSSNRGVVQFIVSPVVSGSHVASKL